MSLTRLARLFSSTTFLAMSATFANSGCATPHACQAGLHRTGEVYCLRGLLDVFSLGLNDLAKRLQSEGIDAVAMPGFMWRTVAQRLDDAHTNGARQEPLVLVGHSYGADDAIHIARFLRRKGVQVKLLVLLDATVPPRVPPNVERCLHLYKPTWLGRLLPFVFAGNPVEAETGNDRTEIVNEIVSRDRLDAAAGYIDHFNVDASPVIHGLVVAEILRVCPPRAAAKPDAAAASVRRAYCGPSEEP